MARLRAAVIGLGRMGNTFDDEIRYEVARGGVFFLPYCHGPSYAASHQTDLVVVGHGVFGEPRRGVDVVTELVHAVDSAPAGPSGIDDEHHRQVLFVAHHPGNQP